MPLRPPLEILKKALAALKDSVQKQKDGLVAHLNRKERISAADEAWLDNDDNYVEEDAMVSRLETASEYECEFAHLDATEMGLVEKLKKFAGEVKVSADMLLQHFGGTSRTKKGCLHVN
jgi:hypothetical protein